LNEKCVTYTANSDQETIRLGKKLGLCLKSGDFVALAGELGSGKTCFTKGLALGLGISPSTVISSPSFALVNEYQGRIPFFHMDAYRLEELSAFLSAGLEEYFYESGVVAMEWSERWPEILPGAKVCVRISILDETSRKITLFGSHPRAVEILRGLEKKLELDRG
jgi:tRNA threonylcarbamoyladenosine biosynthesis protein TsaE